MTLIIETGSGVRGANSYMPVSYVTSYLTARNRQTENSWSSKTTTEQEAAVIAATDYLEKRFFNKFKGEPKETFSSTEAEGIVTFTGLPANGETLTIGDETYTFVTALSGSAYEILIAASISDMGDNLENALKNTSTASGVTHGEKTEENRHVTPENVGGIVTLTAASEGSSGNNTILSGTPTNTTLTAFSGGRDGGLQPLAWPRQYAYDEKGNSIDGIPGILKQAISEYAVRAASSTLLSDPTVDSYGGSIKRKLERVGPLIDETEYVDGTHLATVFKPYPAADSLIKPLLKYNTGGVIRG